MLWSVYLKTCCTWSPCRCQETAALLLELALELELELEQALVLEAHQAHLCGLYAQSKCRARGVVSWAGHGRIQRRAHKPKQ